MPTTATEIIQELQKQKFSPVYVLHGDEPFYIDTIAELIENHAIAPHERAFNQFVLFGKDLSVGTVLSYAKKFPMMADRQVVLIKEAQDIQGIESKEQSRFLEDYFLRPLPSTILVLCFKTGLDERKSWVKAAEKHGVLVNSKKLYDNKLPDWVHAYCHQKGVKISPKAIQMLVEFVGNDLKRMTSEIEKIILNLTISQEITAETIERFVGVSKEYNIFEFQKALIQRDVLKANQIASYFAANTKDNPLMPIIIVLYNFFSKLLLVQVCSDKSEGNLAKLLGINPFFVKDYLVALRNYPQHKNRQIISYLRQADAKSKGIDAGNQSEGEILSELVFTILH